MNFQRKILEIVRENNGLITSEMVKKMDIPSIYLTRMVNQGTLQRVDRGIYSIDKVLLDDYYRLYQKNKKVIFSFLSALFLHDLIDRFPNKLEVTLPRTYNSSHISKDVIIHKVLEKYYPIGLTTKKTIFGNVVACYDMERTVCDLVRFREKIDVEIFKKAIQNYKNHDDRNYIKLRDYAKTLNVSKPVNDLLDVI